MKVYSEYKESGVEWIGKIPRHWKLIEVKRIGSIYNGATPSSSVDDYWNGEIIWVTPTDMNGQAEISLSSRRITDKGYKSCGVMLVPKGSIIVSCRAPIGKVAIAGTELCTNQGCKTIDFDSNNDSKFYYYLLVISSKILNSLGKGTTFMELSSEALKSFKITFPPLPEQQAIVAYLDRKTALIDKIIHLKERKIELLREKRTTLINQVVTKGLDPDVEMKDSGVEWIGEIPVHWRMTKVKHISEKVVDGTHFTPNYVDTGIPFLRVTDIHSKNIDFSSVKYISEGEHKELIARCNPKKGDLLLSKNGTIGITRVIDWDWEFSIFVSLCLIKFRSNYSPYLFSYFFQSDVVDQQIKESSKQSTVTNLHLDKIRELILTMPPVNEQLDILQYLDDTTTELESLIDLEELKIERLKEYRQSLISHVVTGKIRVCEEDLSAAPTRAKAEAT